MIYQSIRKKYMIETDGSVGIRKGINKRRCVYRVPTYFFLDSEVATELQRNRYMTLRYFDMALHSPPAAEFVGLHFLKI